MKQTEQLSPDQAPARWKDWKWPAWVPEGVRTQVKEFWAEKWGRGPRAWIRDMHQQGAPVFGSVVALPDGYAHNALLSIGRYVHGWNNIGRLVREDGSFAYTSFGVGGLLGSGCDADPDDPTEVDWPARQACAAIPFQVVGGRPVNPCEKTGRAGLGELWRWGETLAADALVTAANLDGRRHLLMVERTDGHGWAVPGGCVEAGEDPVVTAFRELEEETGLRLDRGWTASPPRGVPDPRATDEAWMATVVCTVDLGCLPREDFPAVVGGDDAARAAWVPADSFEALAAHLADAYGGKVFSAHVPMLTQAL